MSIENGARFIRRLRGDKALREKTIANGADGFLAVTAAAGASASAYDVVAALARDIDAPRAPGKRLVLVGLVEPKGDDFVAAFNEWYLGNHVEDTYNCPNVKSVRCFRAERGFMGNVPSQYLTIYEFESEDAEQAEKILARYQSDPSAWAKRQPNNGSMTILGAGWYSEALSFGT